MTTGWQTRKLCEVSDTFDGPHATPKTVDSGPIYLGIGALQDGVINLSDTRHVTDDDFTVWTRRVRPQANDVVFSYETRIGQAAIIPDGLECCLGRRMGLIRFNQEKVIPRFFLYQYISPQFRDFLESKTIRGATVDRVSIKDFPSFPILVAPLSEQRRIVAILDEAFEAIAVARANAEQNRQNARALFESYLQSEFSQCGEGWVERRLGDQTLLHMIDGDRGTNYPKATDFLGHGPCLFLNTKNVRPNGFEFDSTMFISAEKDAQLRKGKLQRNDVVMTTRGTIGNLGLYSEEVPFDSVRINSGMLIFRANQTEILPAYLFEILRSGIVKEQINKYTTGAAQPQLPIKTLVNFSIPVPTTLAGQSELVKRIREFEPETQRLESLYQRKIAALDELKQSLLQQAFSGQL
ncbi:restriction endonuclease subunit S [Aeromonas hydrophila]|uniref:restriction endonuclease subunit S n=1 Tax=Aeromonas hydrophila TaxID=644 RepID=UPI0013039DF8|nr:restriction endonuclease subunit S [Aeromonas hydrophila]QGZ74354.1 hypothetical protein GQR50_18510 [Aeromonas hydrophila]